MKKQAKNDKPKNKNPDIGKVYTTRLIILAALSVLAVISIPGIAIGASKHWPWLMIPSIVILASSFYGLPIGWTFLPNLSLAKSVVTAITQDGITVIEDLARFLAKDVKTVLKTVYFVLNKRYITGYILNPEKTELVGLKPKPQEKTEAPSVRCSSCGAVLGENGICSYCGGK